MEHGMRERKVMWSKEKSIIVFNCYGTISESHPGVHITSTGAEPTTSEHRCHLSHSPNQNRSSSPQGPSKSRSICECACAPEVRARSSSPDQHVTQRERRRKTSKDHSPERGAVGILANHRTVLAVLPLFLGPLRRSLHLLPHSRPARTDHPPIHGIALALTSALLLYCRTILAQHCVSALVVLATL